MASEAVGMCSHILGSCPQSSTTSPSRSARSSATGAPRCWSWAPPGPGRPSPSCAATPGWRPPAAWPPSRSWASPRARARPTRCAPRVEDALDAGYEELAVDTVPGLCARLLRDEALEAGIDPFVVPVGGADRVAMLRERVDELTLRVHDFGGDPTALLARRRGAGRPPQGGDGDRGRVRRVGAVAARRRRDAPSASASSPPSTSPTTGCSPSRARSTSAASCCAPSRCCATARTCGRAPRRAGATCSSTTRRTSSSPGCASWPCSPSTAG